MRRTHKYGARKTIVDGVKFDSRAEAGRYIYLKSLERDGEITDLELQPEFELQPKYKKDGKTVRAIKYIADFKYINSDGEIVIEDVKGMETTEFKLKRKMFEYKFPDLKITIVKRRR